MEDFVDVTSVEAFVEAFVEAPVESTSVKVFTYFISSMEASMTAVTAYTEAFMSFHAKCKLYRRPQRRGIL